MLLQSHSPSDGFGVQAGVTLPISETAGIELSAGHTEFGGGTIGASLEFSKNGTNLGLGVNYNTQYGYGANLSYYKWADSKTMAK